MISSKQIESHQLFKERIMVKQATFWDSCWKQDRLDTYGWAAAFIWGALVLLADATGFAAAFAWWDGWGLFFAGAGIIVLIETAIRQFVSKYQRTWTGDLIFALILLAVGLGDWQGFAWLWPLVFIAIAASILRSAFLSQR